ncbi:MAG: hypothetical protein V4723_13845 [Pseudomonadota bacterium]
MNHVLGRAARACVRLCICLAAPCALAQAPQDWIALPAAALEHARGGFTTHSGLALSLGIERLVSINGEIVARTSFHVADVARLSVEQAQQTSATLSAIKLIQNGSDNMVHAALAHQSLGGTVIQNSLDGQHIQSQTVINASANSIGLLTTLNFQGSLSEAIARAAGSR